MGSPPSDARPGHRLRTDLEGLRAVAVVGVVIYHLRGSWLPGGFAGVDVFFVLSGFFITGLLLREGASTDRIGLRNFWGRRARRLLPAAALVLVATMVVSLLFVNAIDARRFAMDGVYTALFGVNWHYAALGTDYLADASPSPLQHFWSLGVEEQFYFVWPLIVLAIVLALGRRPRWRARAIGSVALLASIASFLIAWHQTYTSQPYAYFATYSRVWQLGLGAVIACSAVVLGRLPVSLRTCARWGGLAAIIGFYVLAPLDIVYPAWIAAVPTIGAAFVVLSGLPRSTGEVDAESKSESESVRDPVLIVLRTPAAQRIGRYSYGWYLWHWPPIVLLPLILGRQLTWWELIGLGLATLLAAAASYHLLENPIRISRGLSVRHGRLSLAMGLILIVGGASSAHLIGTRADYVATSTQIATPRGVVLTPSPGAAAAQPIPAVGDGCLVLADAPGNAPECRYLPDKGHGDVILFGDSHAGMYMPALRSAGKQQGWGLRVWTRENCPFADVVKNNSDQGKSCGTWRANALKRIIAAKPSLVVVASYPPRGGPAIHAPGAKKFVATSMAKAKPIYRAGMIRNLKKLKKAGIPVLLIADVPRFDEQAPTCVIENPGNLSVCSAPQAVSDHAPIDEAAARAVPGTHVLSFDSQFCHGGRCYQVVDSIIAYRDANHLTTQMVAHLAPQITAAMKKAMKAMER